MVLRSPVGNAPAEDGILTHGQLVLNQGAHTVTYAGSPIELTKKEFTLLEKLLQNCGIVLTRETLLEQVWGYEYLGETNVVDVYVRYLRSKIDDVYGCHIVHTVRGVGYVIKNEE